MRLRMGLIASAFLINAQAADIDALQDMSLEELVNVQVQSASRYIEDQNQAPGVISVVNADEIKSFGARDLRDVINRLVGVQVLGSHQYAHNVTSLRAGNTVLTEDNVLLLLNGRPLRQTATGVHNGTVYMGFPLELIDHIEVIRGPGSVIYGSNAMVGLINIVTKQSESSSVETTAMVSAGSFGRTQIEAVSGLGNDEYGFDASVNLVRSNGDDFYNVKDESGNLGTYKSGAKSDNLVLNGRYKDFTINSMMMKETEDAHSSTFQYPAQTVTYERYFLDLGYTHEVNPAWDFALNYTLNQEMVDFTISTPTLSWAKGKSDLVEGLVRGRISDDLRLVAGASYAREAGELGSGLNHRDLWRKTLYAQIDYSMWENQKWIAGAQWNLAEGGNAYISPRFGFIQGVGKNWWMKILHSEAYRAPTLVELYSTASFATGNPSLKPVTVQTQDVQLIYQDSDTYAALSVYNSMMKDLITRDNSATPPLYINQGSVHYQGIEFEGKQLLTSNWKVTGNANYQTNKTNTGLKDSTFAPNYMIKAGIEYSGFMGTNIAVFNSYIGSSTDLNATGTTPLNNPKPDAYNLLSANITMDIGKLWGIGKPEHSTLGIYLDNLLDEKIYAPDLLHRNKNNSIPDHWGRGINVSYTYKF